MKGEEGVEGGGDRSVIVTTQHLPLLASWWLSLPLPISRLSALPVTRALCMGDHARVILRIHGQINIHKKFVIDNPSQYL